MTNICLLKGDIETLKIHRPTVSVKFVGYQWSEAYWDIPSDVREKLFYLLSLMLWGPFWVFEAIYTPIRHAIPPIYWVAP